MTKIVNAYRLSV